MLFYQSGMLRARDCKHMQESSQLDIYHVLYETFIKALLLLL